MGIDAKWEDESGGVLAAVLDPRSLLARALRDGELSHTVCLRFIDPYGDAVFNQAQSAHLAQELRELRAATATSEAADHLAQVIDLVARAQDQTHTYIKFIGD